MQWYIGLVLIWHVCVQQTGVDASIQTDAVVPDQSKLGVKMRSPTDEMKLSMMEGVVLLIEVDQQLQALKSFFDIIYCISGSRNQNHAYTALICMKILLTGRSV